MLSPFFFIAATLLLSLNFVRPLGLAISDWLYFAAFALAVAQTALAKRQDWTCWTHNRLALPAGLILLGAVLSTTRAQDVPTAAMEIVQQIYVVTVFVSLTWWMVRRGYTSWVVGAFIASGLFSALVAWVDRFTGSNFGPILSGAPDVQFWYRYAGTLGHPNKLGYFLVLTSILTLATLAGTRSSIRAWGLGAALAVQVFAIYLSGSVTAYIGLFLGGVLLVVSSKNLRSRMFFIVLPVLAIAIPLMAVITVLDIRGPLQRIEPDAGNVLTLSLDRVQSVTANARVAIYKQALAQIEKSPIIGAGFDQTSTSGIAGTNRLLDTTVHNVLLQAFYIGGLFVVIGWLSIYAYLAWESIRVLHWSNHYALALGFAASVLAIIVMDQFEDAIYQREKWLLIGLLVGYVSEQARRPVQSLPDRNLNAGLLVAEASTLGK